MIFITNLIDSPFWGAGVMQLASIFSLKIRFEDKEKGTSGNCKTNRKTNEKEEEEADEKWHARRGGRRAKTKQNKTQTETNE